MALAALAPLLGSIIAPAAASSLGLSITPLLASAIGGGLGTWAATGDPLKGLEGGAMGFGLGSLGSMFGGMSGGPLAGMFGNTPGSAVSPATGAMAAPNLVDPSALSTPAQSLAGFTPGAPTLSQMISQGTGAGDPISNAVMNPVGAAPAASGVVPGDMMAASGASALSPDSILPGDMMAASGTNSASAAKGGFGQIGSFVKAHPMMSLLGLAALGSAFNPKMPKPTTYKSPGLTPYESRHWVSPPAGYQPGISPEAMMLSPSTFATGGEVTIPGIPAKPSWSTLGLDILGKVLGDPTGQGPGGTSTGRPGLNMGTPIGAPGLGAGGRPGLHMFNGSGQPTDPGGSSSMMGNMAALNGIAPTLNGPGMGMDMSFVTPQTYPSGLMGPMPNISTDWGGVPDNTPYGIAPVWNAATGGGVPGYKNGGDLDMGEDWQSQVPRHDGSDRPMTPLPGMQALENHLQQPSPQVQQMMAQRPAWANMQPNASPSGADRFVPGSPGVLPHLNFGPQNFPQGPSYPANHPMPPPPNMGAQPNMQMQTNPNATGAPGGMMPMTTQNQPAQYFGQGPNPQGPQMYAEGGGIVAPNQADATSMMALQLGLTPDQILQRQMAMQALRPTSNYALGGGIHLSAVPQNTMPMRETMRMAMPMPKPNAYMKPLKFDGGGNIPPMMGGMPGMTPDMAVPPIAGDGSSDSIPATIDGKSPALLSSGEHIIPADVVAHLGNGSTQAGNKALHAMVNRVRMKKAGSGKMPARLNAMAMLPA